MGKRNSNRDAIWHYDPVLYDKRTDSFIVDFEDKRFALRLSVKKKDMKKATKGKMSIMEYWGKRQTIFEKVFNPQDVVVNIKNEDVLSLAKLLYFAKGKCKRIVDKKVYVCFYQIWFGDDERLFVHQMKIRSSSKIKEEKKKKKEDNEKKRIEDEKKREIADSIFEELMQENKNEKKAMKEKKKKKKSDAKKKKEMEREKRMRRKWKKINAKRKREAMLKEVAEIKQRDEIEDDDINVIIGEEESKIEKKVEVKKPKGEVKESTEIVKEPKEEVKEVEKIKQSEKKLQKQEDKEVKEEFPKPKEIITESIESKLNKRINLLEKRMSEKDKEINKTKIELGKKLKFFQDHIFHLQERIDIKVPFIFETTATREIKKMIEKNYDLQLDYFGNKRFFRKSNLKVFKELPKLGYKNIWNLLLLPELTLKTPSIEFNFLAKSVKKKKYFIAEFSTSWVTIPKGQLNTENIIKEYERMQMSEVNFIDKLMQVERQRKLFQLILKDKGKDEEYKIEKVYLVFLKTKKIGWDINVKFMEFLNQNQQLFVGNSQQREIDLRDIYEIILLPKEFIEKRKEDK